jgi:hypothetical protein
MDLPAVSRIKALGVAIMCYTLVEVGLDAAKQPDKDSSQD